MRAQRPCHSCLSLSIWQLQVPDGIVSSCNIQIQEPNDIGYIATTGESGESTSATITA